jgi:hypothetical protein
MDGKGEQGWRGMGGRGIEGRGGEVWREEGERDGGKGGRDIEGDGGGVYQTSPFPMAGTFCCSPVDIKKLSD